MTSVLQNLPPVLVLFFIKSDYKQICVFLWQILDLWGPDDHGTVPQNVHRRSQIKAR